MSFLSRINEGMDVFDRTGDKIGEVDYVLWRRTLPPRKRAQSVSNRDPREDTLVDLVADAFRADDMPDELRQRLQMHGFLLSTACCARTGMCCQSKSPASPATPCI